MESRKWHVGTKLNYNFTFLHKGGLIPFTECIQGHDERISSQFVETWKDQMVNINGILFEISVEFIASAMDLSMKKKK